MLYWALLLLGLCVTVVFVVDEAKAEGPRVKTNTGELEGYVFISRSAQNFYVFHGIPYAKPPVGQLRFEPPEAAEPWTGLKQARDVGPVCPQVNIYFNGKAEGSEDCLYLSVYSKKLDGNLPVVVHFHGGGWILGDGPSAKTPEYLMDTDIVVVDVNYRIGILGFLSFEDGVLPGNMGLKDQVLALKWVKDNIKSFGGDPDKVTIMGECAGADAVYHHMISPLSAGLFHRGIAESGSTYTPQAIGVPGIPKERAKKVAEAMGCSKGDTKEMVSCLKKKDALEIASQLPTFIEWQIDPVYTFGPVIEPDSPGAFLVGPVSKWVPAKVPLLTGITSGEGLLRTLFFTRKGFDYSVLNNDGFNRLMPLSLTIKDTSSKPNEILPKIKTFYKLGDSISDKDFQKLTDMYGDIWFSCGVIEGAKKATGDVYMYYYDHMGQLTMSEFFGDKTMAKGAFHSEDAIYIWQLKGTPPLRGKDFDISRDLVKLWTNFIISGNPTPDDSLGVIWTPYMPDENYLTISSSGYKMNKGLLTDRYNFWKSLDIRDKYP